MERVEATRGIALKFWWALVWRYALCLLLIAGVQAFLIGFITELFRLTPDENEGVSLLITLLVGLPLVLAASWECLYRILEKRIDGYELILIQHEDEEEEDA